VRGAYIYSKTKIVDTESLESFQKIMTDSTGLSG
jgi:hypothetical protein